MFHTFIVSGILRLRVLFRRRLPREQADERGERLLRLLVVDISDTHSDHAVVVGWLSSDMHQRYKIDGCPTMNGERPGARMRLPVGFCGLRADLGAVIRSYRRGDAGEGEPIPPKVFAADIGISRVALSRIENDKAWPRPETLGRIMAAFKLDWPQVAEAGPNQGPCPRTPNTDQDGQQADLCDTLRWGRRQLGWTLAELARRSGVSASQLSRIERGQATRSAVFTWHPEDDGIVQDDRRIVFAHPLLADVAAGRLRHEET